MQKNLHKSRWHHDLAGAWVFYTILPKWSLSKTSFIRIARFAPIIGILIGIFQSVIWIGLNKFIWPKESITLIVLSFGYLITGGLHLDGLIDTTDGIAAGKERRFEAMRDSRIGAIGVQSLMIILMLQIAALLRLNNYIPYAMPVAAFWGRFSTLWAIEKFAYIKNPGIKSSGSLHHKNWEGLIREAIPSAIVLIVICSLFLFKILEVNNHFKIVLSILLCFLPSIVIPHLVGKTLKGHTGDSYGASVVLVETFILLFLSVVW
ncbi:adenosylcobinamide-GDP ribazoletransferase [Prochlorococcus sp. MIT 1223]|uniref:adenosylcobinamide-GDP ribazoletransferase n=1 Tax=Prochlorococcus sp. MIT 1223 TaxID=3096217 RepID=UPI002A75173D|nr:adenosylcobinamide-GDP ribazoletransferase [Prochlorococcus sp. MIT 1223]